MTKPPAGTVGSTELVFQAPPAPPQDDDAVEDLQSPVPSVRHDRGGGPAVEPGPARLRMLEPARAAASRLRISEAQIRAALEHPEDVRPDARVPARTHRRRDGVVVTTGNDGMILRVARSR